MMFIRIIVKLLFIDLKVVLSHSKKNFFFYFIESLLETIKNPFISS